jgi:uncharacterized protein YdhG (YjbR/CyaY superfamily)
MSVEKQIADYIATQPEAKRRDLQELHERILQTLPPCRLWLTDGKNEEGRVVTNPNIGYGQYTIEYADGTAREFYQIGLSANTAGISVYIMGLDDRKYLPQTYADKIGKASVTGYCIRFRRLADINTNLLEEAIRDGFGKTSGAGRD